MFGHNIQQQIQIILYIVLHYFNCILATVMISTIVTFKLSNYNHFNLMWNSYRISCNISCTGYKYELPEDDQQFRPKHVGALIN